ncbi:hypothetical protein [Thermaerobacillus caldiproteolyticus]|uniref:hypothetical protein n=1 Tax=Thermaerobacillus caldiproteolyticus TaxID=247480 RepID=UPI0018F123F9|nr:hypothetical protein [Anoxybacillus caldiproteolyticus]
MDYNEILLKFNEIVKKKNLKVKIGSVYEYNLSNVNHLRKDHIVKDESSMSAYCSNKKIIRAYVRYLNQHNKFSLFMKPDLCISCVKKFLKEFNVVK